MPKHLFRRLRRSPLFTAMTILTLAIGIGANTAVFSVVNGILLKPLPFPEPDRLVSVWQSAPGIGMKDLNASPATYYTYREEGKVFDAMGLWRTETMSVTGIAEPEEIPVLRVTADVLPMLRIQPALGRWFMDKEDLPGSPKTTMLSYGYWQRRFGGSAAVIGRRILLDGEAHEVIGVMPRAFRFLNTDPSLIVPFQLDRNKVFVGNFSYQAVARLKPGVTIAQANRDVARMLPMLATKFPPAPGMNVKMIEEAHLAPDVRPLKADVIGDIGKVLWVLMGTVGIVLFIACANVANLLLVRAEARQHELAVRVALGASRWQVARELLFESVALGAAGGAFALGLAYAGIPLLIAVSPGNLPRLHEISIDAPVLLFTLVLSLAAGLLFGLAPAWKYARPGVSTALREGGRTASQGRERHRARSALVVIQVALALVLLISSGLMIRTLAALKHVQPGFSHPDQILTFRVSIPQAQVPQEEMVVRTQEEMMRRISALPGVSSVSLINILNMDGNGWSDPIFAEDHVYSAGQIPPVRRYKMITPGFFHTMGIPLLAGRDLTWTELYDKRPVVLVSESLAREYWSTPSAALGKRVRESPKGVWREVIGVVGNVHDDGVSHKPPLTVYWPVLLKDLWGDPLTVQRTVTFVILSPRTGSAGFLKEAQQAVWSVNPNVTIASVATMRQIYDRSLARTSFTFIMLTIAAAMALLLGIVGIYGVISYSVAQRTREIGIRIALGASQGSVRGMFVRYAFVLAGTGIACGLAGAFAATRLMTALLFGVSVLDPLTYGAVSLILVATALLAAYIPAYRATGIEPVSALRAE